MLFLLIIQIIDLYYLLIFWAAILHFLTFPKMLKGDNSTPTWKYLLGPYMAIIKREKNYIAKF